MLVAFFSPSFHFLLNNFAILLLFCPPYLFPPLHSPPVRPSPPLPSCPSVLSSPVPFLPLLSHLIRICSFLPLFIPSCAFPPSLAFPFVLSHLHLSAFLPSPPETSPPVPYVPFCLASPATSASPPFSLTRSLRPDIS